MKAIQQQLIRRNLRVAHMKYGPMVSSVLKLALRGLTRQFAFALEVGDLILLDGSWYVTHSGLLRLATRRGCIGIRVEPASQFCFPEQSRWAFRATAYKAEYCKGFHGYGDADPSNVSAMVRGAEMRIAETRAVNRALRKAYGIGICSVEEIGTFNPNSEPAASSRKPKPIAQPEDHPLRDRLLVLIRQHGLDSGLVKLYAADFCGVSEIKQATRERMRAFVDQLAQEANCNVEELQQKLAAYQLAKKSVA